MEKNQNRKKSSNRRVYRILYYVFLLVFVVAVGVMIRNYIVQKNAEKKFEELATVNEKQQDVAETTETPEEKDANALLAELGIDVPEKNLDWEALQEENADIHAWIYVPGTNIDYPVLQHPEDDNYYLDHNLDGSSGYPGCIFIQRYNNLDFTDPNTVLYGHNMKNGSMFQNLHNFEDGVFFDEHRYAFVYTPENTFAYEIFAAYEFSNDHLLYNYDFWDNYGFDQFIEDVKNSRGMTNHVREDVEVAAGNHMITMSTCINGKPNNRYLVSAVLLNDAMVEE